MENRPQENRFILSPKCQPCPLIIASNFSLGEWTKKTLFLHVLFRNLWEFFCLHSVQKDNMWCSFLQVYCFFKAGPCSSISVSPEHTILGPGWGNSAFPQCALAWGSIQSGSQSLLVSPQGKSSWFYCVGLSAADPTHWCLRSPLCTAPLFCFLSTVTSLMARDQLPAHPSSPLVTDWVRQEKPSVQTQAPKYKSVRKQMGLPCLPIPSVQPLQPI